MRPPADPPRRADEVLLHSLPPGSRGLSIIADLHQEHAEVRDRRGAAVAWAWYWKEALALTVRYTWIEWRATGKGSEPMATFLADLRFGLRMLFKTPGLSLVAVLTLALGVGMTTHTYSALVGTVLRGVPVPGADRLDVLYERIERLDIERLSTPLHDYLDLAERQSVFEAVGAYYHADLNLAGDEGPPERVAGAIVSGNALRIAGVPPLLGRVFEDDEDLPDARPTIVLSYDLWMNRFNGSPDVVGRSTRVNGQSAEVIGVMPKGFRFPFEESAWAPYHFDPSTTPRHAAYITVFGRRKVGVSPETASAELDRISRDIEAVYPQDNEGVRLRARPFAERYMPPEINAVMFLMMGSTFGVLLIACANVANLLLARASIRGREVAIRTALGASRGRVIRQLLAEALVLALLGGAVGVGLAYGGVRVLNDVLLGIQKPYWIDIRVDLTTLAFAVGVTLLATVFAGTVPALRASGGGFGDALRDEARGSSSRRMGRFTTSLVIGEIAMSCGLLIASGLMIRSIINVNHLDLGFRPDPVLTGWVTLNSKDYPTQAQREQFLRRLEERLAAEPGVRSVSLSEDLPALGASDWWVTVDGETYASDREVPRTNGSVVTSGFFETMEIPVLRGRDFLPSEIWDATEPVAIVNESFARHFLGDRDPMSARVRLGHLDSTQPWLRVVGVVPDVYVGGGVGGLGDDRRPKEFLYVTPAVEELSEVAVAVRADGAPADLAPRMRAIVGDLDPNLPVFALQPMTEALKRATWAFGLFGSLFTIFGLAALFMASVGLYGVMAFSVAQRRQEIGVRMALGAAPRSVLHMVLQEGAVRLGLGTGLGLLLGLLLAKPLSFVTYGVTLSDPFVYVFILGTLGTVGLLACVLPARSATRADPAEAMRPG